MSGLFNIQNRHGLTENFLTEEQISTFSERFKTYDAINISEGKCYGTDINHPDFAWFEENFFPLIKEYTGLENIYPIFAMYADFNSSFKIHQDIKNIPNDDPSSLQFASFLIPVSVDHDPALCNKNATMLFRRAMRNEPDPTVASWHDLIPQYRRDLGHMHILTAIYYWMRGAMVWWSSPTFHCGIDFDAAGITSKQMFVIHTYVKVK